jgi:hypothetical protein
VDERYDFVKVIRMKGCDKEAERYKGRSISIRIMRKAQTTNAQENKQSSLATDKPEPLALTEFEAEEMSA